MNNKTKRQQTAKRFSKSAQHYDQVAHLQHEVSRRLIERLDFVQIDPKVILDVGCGTGSALEPLQQRYPKAQVIGLDLAEGMTRLALLRHDCDLVQADMKQLPFADQSVQLIFSNLALHWETDQAVLFAELHRVLAPGGLLVFTVPGPDTLCELRESWRAVDSHPHVNTFIDMHDLGDLLVRCRFAEPILDVDYFSLHYSEALELMRELKTLGSHVTQIDRKKGLISPEKLKACLDHYEQYRIDDKIPATYEIIYGHAWGSEPVLSSTDSEGNIRISVDQIRRSSGF